MKLQSTYILNYKAFLRFQRYYWQDLPFVYGEKYILIDFCDSQGRI